jgi:uncharacterized protein
MKILVDADACPVKQEVVKIAKKYDLEVIMVLDTSHIYKDDYSKVITVDKANDSVDFKIICKANKGDIIVTQDYGLASMCLGKGCSVIHQNGFLYTLENIDRMLFERYVNKKIRQDGKRGSYIKKRTKENNIDFEVAFNNLIKSLA